MEEHKRLRVKRCGLKGSITKMTEKVHEALSAELETVNMESISESRRILVSTTTEQLRTKLKQIIELDGAIARTIDREEELEAEICDADTYQSNLEQNIAFLTEFIKKAKQLPVARPPPRPSRVTDRSEDKSTPPVIPQETTEPGREATATLSETDVTKKPSESDTPLRTHVSSHTSILTERTHQTYTRLPKLPLPTFDGNPLEWQAFWDSFIAAVDLNPGLTPVQKLNYLRTQLHGDAGSVIGGFPLSDHNYPQCVKLLKERFGQQYKLVDAHMETLYNVSMPSNNLTSLQAFYDTIQSHIRALSALDKPPDSYGSLLTTVILSKLPSEIKIHMARDHYDSEWTITELLDSILKEIRIYEAGHQPGRKL